MPINFRSNKLPPAFLVLVAVAGVHGLLLLNDGVYWDDWLILKAHETGDACSIQEWFTESGVPLVGYIHRCMGSFPNTVFAYKATAFCAVVASALLIYANMTLWHVTTPAQNVAVAIFSVSYPAFRVHMLLVMLPFLLCHAVFWAGMLFVGLGFHSSHRQRGLLQTMAAVVTLCFGFTINSLLLFYMGLMTVLLLLRQTRSGTEVPSHVGRETIVSYVILLMLPFQYWVFKRWVWPVSGLYQNYNTLQFCVSNVVEMGRRFVDSSIIAQFSEMCRWFTTHRLVALGFVLGSAVAACWGAFVGDVPRGVERAVGLVVCGAGLLVCAIAPYALVGKAPAIHGVNTRHALLVGFPMALILVGGLSLLCACQFQWVRWCQRFLLLMMFNCFWIAQVTNYLGWQGLWVRDRSVIVNLSAIKQARNYSVYWIHESFWLGDKTWDQQSHPFYAWASIFRRAWGGESRIGLHAWGDPASGLNPLQSPEFPLDPQLFFVPRYSLGDFNPAGPQAVLSIEEGIPALSSMNLCARYLFYRHLQPSGLNAFLRRISMVHVTPVLRRKADK